MLQLILMTTLLSAKPAPKVAQAQTCQWPHVCATQPVAQVQTCQYPNKCATEAAPVKVADVPVETCQWPHVCVAETQVHTCDWPNKCS